MLVTWVMHSILRDRTGKTNEGLDMDPDFIAFKEKYNKKFNELSNVAKLSATYKILTGFESMNDKISVYKKHSRHPRTFVPTSKTKGEISLLDPRLVSKFFKAYNDNLESKYRKTTTLGRAHKGVALESMIRKICKG